MAETHKTAVKFLDQFEPDLFWQKNGRKVIWGVIVALAIVVIVVQMQRQAAEHENEAATRLVAATDPAVLLQLAHEYKNKSIGAQALLRLAEVQSQVGRFAEAVATWQEFLTVYPQHPLADAVQLSQATTLEIEGKIADAKIRYLQTASRLSGYTGVAAKLGVARCAETLGQVKEARQLYEELAPAVAGTPWALPVAVRLDVLSRSQEFAVTGAAPVKTTSGDMVK